MRIDLNCDIGESFGHYRVGDDPALLKVASSANIACGFHAGDPVVMMRTVRLAAHLGVAIGAHPGYPDLQGFGRRDLAMSSEELEAALVYQLGALAGFAGVAGVPLRHVKPHGALYNAAARRSDLADCIARAIFAFDPALIVVTLPGSMLAQAARTYGLPVAYEGFADRAYEDDGGLVPRNHTGAVLHDPALVCERAVRMVTAREVISIHGNVIPLRIDTLCIHGDTPGAAATAAQLRRLLEAAGAQIAPLSAEYLVP